MADILDDGELYLPPKFLSDDDDDESSRMLPFEFSYDFDSNQVSSDSSSPVESVFGSTETESDDEDFLAELTRQIADTSLVNEGLVKPGSPRKPSPIRQFQLTSPNSNPDVCVYPNQSLSYQKLHTIQRMREYLMLKEQQATALEQRMQAFVYNGEGSNNVRPVCPSWYSLQQAQQQQRRLGLGLATRSMLLGNPGAGNRSCAGTGVFIPRNAGNPSDSRKVPQVTQPTRLAQTLNFNLQEMDPLPYNKPNSYADFTLQNDPGLRVRNNNRLSQQGVDRRAITGFNEFKLPKEWTY